MNRFECVGAFPYQSSCEFIVVSVYHPGSAAITDTFYS
jgi:hypothetical protein